MSRRDGKSKSMLLNDVILNLQYHGIYLGQQVVSRFKDYAVWLNNTYYDDVTFNSFMKALPFKNICHQYL